MNRKIICFCIGAIFCTAMQLCAQQSSTAAIKTENHGRIERVEKNEQEVVRFFDKDGKMTREMQLGVFETKARLKKDKAFDSATFGMKISTTLASALESGRKHFGKDMEVKRRISKSAYASANGNYLVVEEHRADFLNYVGVTESESSGEAVEAEKNISIYDLSGNEVFKVGPDEGFGASISNTGDYIFVGVEGIGQKVFNQNKELLATIPINSGNQYFSENDKFVIFVERTSSDMCAISVYDTKENRFELRKINVDAMIFQGIKWVKISETERRMTIQHIWDPERQEKKVDTIQF